MTTIEQYTAQIKADQPSPQVQDADELRPMTTTEKAAWYLHSATVAKANDEAQAAADAAATAKAALLARLGITADEAKLLIG